MKPGRMTEEEARTGNSPEAFAARRAARERAQAEAAKQQRQSKAAALAVGVGVLVLIGMAFFRSFTGGVEPSWAFRGPGTSASDTQPNAQPDYPDTQPNAQPDPRPRPAGCDAGMKLYRDFYNGRFGGRDYLQQVRFEMLGTRLEDEYRELSRLWATNGSSTKWTRTLDSIKKACR